MFLCVGSGVRGLRWVVARHAAHQECRLAPRPWPNQAQPPPHGHPRGCTARHTRSGSGHLQPLRCIRCHRAGRRRRQSNASANSASNVPRTARAHGGEHGYRRLLWVHTRSLWLRPPVGPRVLRLPWPNDLSVSRLVLFACVRARVARPHSPRWRNHRVAVCSARRTRSALACGHGPVVAETRRRNQNALGSGTHGTCQHSGVAHHLHFSHGMGCGLCVQVQAVQGGPRRS